MSVPLFPLVEYWWLYAAFTAAVLVLLALDLGVFHRKAHAVGVREAAIWTVVWIVLALGFNVALYQYSWPSAAAAHPCIMKIAYHSASRRPGHVAQTWSHTCPHTV